MRPTTNSGSDGDGGTLTYRKNGNNTNGSTSENKKWKQEKSYNGRVVIINLTRLKTFSGANETVPIYNICIETGRTFCVYIYKMKITIKIPNCHNDTMTQTQTNALAVHHRKNEIAHYFGVIVFINKMGWTGKKPFAGIFHTTSALIDTLFVRWSVCALLQLRIQPKTPWHLINVRRQ